MFKRKPLLIVALISFIFFSYGCSQQTEGVILSKDSNSEYVKTFNDLSLGTILDFNIQIPNEDERWFTLWVEKYENGQKISKPLSELSFPNNPNEEEEGHIGFGLVKTNEDYPVAFLYGFGSAAQSFGIDKEMKMDSSSTSSWQSVMEDDEKIEIKLYEPTLLGVYIETTSNSIRIPDLTDEADVEQLTSEYETILLLKVKVEERTEN